MYLLGHENVVTILALGAIPARCVIVDARLSVAAREVRVTVGTAERAGSTDIAVDALLSPPASGAITTGAADIAFLACFGSWLGLDQLFVTFDKVSVHLGKLAVPLLTLGSVSACSVAHDTVLTIAAGQASFPVGLTRAAGAANSEV
jgi:hypothetical protein